MSRFADKVCLMCGKTYSPTAGVQKYCVDCGPIVVREHVRAAMKKHRALHPEYDMEYATEHREQKRLCGQRWELAHPGYRKVQYLQNPGRTKAWYAANPERKRIIKRKAKAQRRSLGFVPLNIPFAGCEGHHINKSDVIYLPRSLHRSIYHNQHTGQGMVEMNRLAMAYLTEDWT